MPRVETVWRKDADWKSRYSQLYSSRRLTPPKIDDPHRISFMSNECSPYTTLLMRMRANSKNNQDEAGSILPSYYNSLQSQQSECYSVRPSVNSSDLGGNETMLLDMVRARSRELEEESLDKTLNLPCDDDSESPASEACVHGLSVRMTERSVSRSRVSRMSTKRDMDIPSILAFTTTTPAPVHLEIPAFQKARNPQCDEVPRWSIRRSVCPVCSQKWKDRSSITNVKCSGNITKATRRWKEYNVTLNRLKRNLSSELPSIIAPARLRTSITLGYVPRPTLAAVDEDVGVVHGGLRNTGAAWQLTRARRFRTPKLRMPPPEATAPPFAAAPMARKDLDIRVHRFLSDNKVKVKK